MDCQEPRTLPPMRNALEATTRSLPSRLDLPEYLVFLDSCTFQIKKKGWVISAWRVPNALVYGSIHFFFECRTSAPQLNKCVIFCYLLTWGLWRWRLRNPSTFGWDFLFFQELVIVQQVGFNLSTRLETSELDFFEGNVFPQHFLLYSPDHPSNIEPEKDPIWIGKKTSSKPPFWGFHEFHVSFRGRCSCCLFFRVRFFHRFHHGLISPFLNALGMDSDPLSHWRKRWWMKPRSDTMSSWDFKKLMEENEKTCFNC